MTEKKRTAAQFSDDAETQGLESLINTRLNDEKVSKGVESGTETNYTRMLKKPPLEFFGIVLSNRYEKRNPGAIPYDRKTAKHFMEGVVRGCCAGEK